MCSSWIAARHRACAACLCKLAHHRPRSSPSPSGRVRILSSAELTASGWQPTGLIPLSVLPHHHLSMRTLTMRNPWQPDRGERRELGRPLGAGLVPVGYITTSLSMPSYFSSDIGGSATFASGGSREDVNRLLPAEQTTGTLYYAALVNISQASTTGDYFMHFKTHQLLHRTSFRQRCHRRTAVRHCYRQHRHHLRRNRLCLQHHLPVVVKHDDDTRCQRCVRLDSCSGIERAPLALQTGTPSTSIVAIAISRVRICRRRIDGIRWQPNWADTLHAQPHPATLAISKTAPDV